MEKIAVFIARDGRRFNCPDECTEYERWLDKIDATDFNKLPVRKKWNTWKDQQGTWYCPQCLTELGDGPNRASPFHGSSVHCGACDKELTRRTGGGQSDPFEWILMEKKLMSAKSIFPDDTEYDTLKVEVERLKRDNEYLVEENKFLCVELTKINNVIQPLWNELRARRVDLGRNPHTGEST